MGPGRAVLTAGVAALTGGALAFTPSVLPATMRTVEVVRPVALARQMEPFSSSEVTAALALIGQLAPLNGHGTITVRLGSHEPGGSTTATVTTGRAVDTAAVPIATAPPADDPAQNLEVDAALADPVPLNAASNLIDGVYAISRYWANYVSLELGPWLINWIPFGYLISDQIYIWYQDFVLPVVDSFVYNFLDPVVNDPLNPGVWLDGISTIVNTAVNGVVDGIVNEIQYIVSFGWFPFPLPPLPNFPLPGLASASTTVATASASDEADMTATDAMDTATAEVTEEDSTAPSVGEPTAATEEQEGDAQDSGQLVVDVDEAAQENTDEPAVETSEEAQDPDLGTADDAPDSEGEPDGTDRSEDADQSDDVDQPDNEDADQSDDVDQPDNEDADKGAAPDTDSGSGGDSGGTDSGGADESGSDG